MTQAATDSFRKSVVFLFEVVGGRQKNQSIPLTAVSVLAHCVS
jgi:hypothetical protein